MKFSSLAFGATLALGLSTLTAKAQGVWTVDDDGPADFASISTAAAAVPAGDVLLIYPGEYGFVLVTKELSLLGVRGSGGAAHLQELSIRDTATTTVSDLDVDSVYLTRIPGRSRISGVRTDQSFVAEQVGELFVARCDLRSDSGATLFKGAAGAEVRSGAGQSKSRAQFVDCVLRGGVGLPFDLDAGVGGEGLLVNRADVLLVHCSLQGGTGIPGLFGPGKPGNGLVVIEGSVELRASPGDILAGGPAGASGAAVTGMAAIVGFGGLAILAGVATEGALEGAVQIVPPRPCLVWSKLAGQAQLGIFGNAGDSAFWLVSLGAAFDPTFVPLYGLDLTLDLQQIFAGGSVSLVGQTQPVGPTFSLPSSPAFLGVSVSAQALVLSSAASLWQLSNGDDLLLLP
jgi:hypothetical protein